MWKTWNRELGSFTNRMGIERGVGNTWGWPVRLTELSSVDFERTYALSFGFGWVWSGGGSRVPDGNGLWVDWCCLCLELSCGFFWSKWCEAIRQMPKIHLISELIQDKHSLLLNLRLTQNLEYLDNLEGRYHGSADELWITLAAVSQANLTWV